MTDTVTETSTVTETTDSADYTDPRDDVDSLLDDSSGDDSSGDDSSAGSGGAATYYANCSEARAAGAAPVYAGDPGYAAHLDRDGDGVGCE